MIPIITPIIAAIIAPINSEAINGNSKWILHNAETYAPTDINPACPSVNCPKYPVAKFNDDAKIILIPAIIIIPNQ